MEVIFDYAKMKKLSRRKILARPFNHARYREFYPVRNLVSIQEGGTPLVRSKNIEQEFKLPFELYFKYEAQNPTGSFKDRGSSVEIARALELGARRVICASTGNMGASVAAYSAMANLACYIFTPKFAPQIKMEQILAYGAKVYHIRGDYTKAARMVERANNEFGIYMLGDYLWRREGTKSVGFEICDQLKNPDYVICPIGNGTLISAVWKAFKEFRTLGWIKHRPKMIGVQASTCQPVCRAFARKSKISPLCGRTVATAIECGDPLDGERALRAVGESKGFCVAVNDKEILRARQLLARREGLFAEPAGAVALAGLLKAKSKINPGSKVVCLVTGHGLKTPRTAIPGKPLEVSGRLSVVDRIFRP